jgi:iron complex outermembrane receptor protein
MRALRTSLLATSTLVGLAALAAAPSAYAQDVAIASAPVATEVEELVITGTRLRLPDYVQANPVVSVGEAQIENSGTTNLGEYLQEIPALSNSLDLSQGADTTTPSLAGITLLDLRNLGTDRTLVLVNGRRHVASYPGSSAVDINTIPIALVERVEVLTGGASAVYGADGVSGVVNFIMKRDFDGVDVRAQHTWTQEGGGGDNYFSAVVGHNFLDDRANLTAAYEYNNQDRLTYWDRSYTRPGQRVILFSNPEDPGSFAGGEDDPDIVDNVLLTDVRYYDTSPGGSVYTNFFTAPTNSGVSFLGNGDPFVDGEYLGGAFMIGGSGSPLDLFNDDLIPGVERHAFNLSGNIEVSPTFRMSGEAKYVRTESAFYAQPSYEYGLFISEDNPYIPANVLADARMPYGQADTIPRDYFDTPDDPTDDLIIYEAFFGLPGPGVLVGRDNFDLGTQNYDVERETIRLAGGAEIDLTPTVRLNISAVHGTSTQVLAASNVRINERFLAATDVVIDPATDEAVCRSNLDPAAVPVGDIFATLPFDPSSFGSTFTPGPNSGCLPLNIFGEGVADPAAIDWINTESTSEAKITQDVLTAFVSGDSSQWFSLPAGPLSFVVGAEYRKEKSDSQPSPIEELAESLDVDGFSTLGRAVRTKGMFDVKEAFTEVSVPVVRDMPFAESIVLQGAYRWSDYSNMGRTDTWNYGARWQVNDWIMLRGTQARAVRAPNISDLFLGRSQTFASIADPCSSTNIDQGENPALREANCIAHFEALGLNIGDFENTSSDSTPGFISGNPNLEPETAETLTYGFVFTPQRFVPGLSISVDYYDIEIEDAIQSFTAQTIVNNCYDLPAGNAFCGLIDRLTGAPEPGRLSRFEQLPQNIATYTTRGIDFTANYRLDPTDFGIQRDIGRFDFRLVGNVLKELVYAQGGTAAPTNSLGAGQDSGAPELQITFDATWTWRQFAVNYGLSYFDETRRFGRSTMATETDLVAPDQWYFPARELHDVQVSYTYDDRFKVYGGVNNLTDQEPSWDSYNYPVSPQGRAFYVGVNATF